MDKDQQRWHAHQAALYLDRVKSMGDKVKALKLTIEELEIKAEGVGSIDYSKERVKVSPTRDKIPDGVSKLNDLKEERKRKLELYEGEIGAVIRALDRMENETHSAILEAHYIGGKTWREVSEEWHYSKRGIMKARQNALAAFYDVMPPAQRFAEIPKAI